jgi:hypothetical protein
MANGAGGQKILPYSSTRASHGAMLKFHFGHRGLLRLLRATLNGLGGSGAGPNLAFGMAAPVIGPVGPMFFFGGASFEG